MTKRPESCMHCSYFFEFFKNQFLILGATVTEKYHIEITIVVRPHRCITKFKIHRSIDMFCAFITVV